MRSRSILVAVSMLALCAVAYAGGPHDSPKRPRSTAPPRVTVSTSADLAVNGEARATSDATSAADAAASSAQEQVASSGGNSFSTSSDVLALELPGHTGATPVDGCQVSRGSLGAFGIGSGGRVKFDPECVAYTRCLEVAAVLERLGHADAAARAVVSCSGVQLPPDVLELVAPAAAVPAAPPEVAVFVTQEQLERAFKAAQSTSGK